MATNGSSNATLVESALEHAKGILKRLKETAPRLSGTVAASLATFILTLIVSSVMDATITLNRTYIVMIIVGLMAFATVLYVSHAADNVSRAASRMARTADLRAEEVYHVGSEGSKFRGVSFREMQRYVEDAERSIFVLAASYANDSLESSDHQSRIDYFEAIQRKIKASPRTFTYTRIQQIPKHVTSLREHLKSVTANHCLNALEAAQWSPTVNVMRIDEVDMTGFMLVDDRILLVQMNGMNAAGNRHTFALVTVHDNHGQQIKRVVQQSHLLEKLARRCDLESFRE